MFKKAQALSLNTIIIAIIVLIVLVVLIMLFTGYFGTRFTPGVTSCVNAGGVCTSPDKYDTDCGYNEFGEEITTIKATCPNGEWKCCSQGGGANEKPADFSSCGSEGEICCPAFQGDLCKSGLECHSGSCRVPLTPCGSPKACGAEDDCEDGSMVSGTVCEDSGAVCCTKKAEEA